MRPRHDAPRSAAMTYSSIVRSPSRTSARFSTPVAACISALFFPPASTTASTASSTVRPPGLRHPGFAEACARELAPPGFRPPRVADAAEQRRPAAAQQRRRVRLPFRRVLKKVARQRRLRDRPDDRLEVVAGLPVARTASLSVACALPTSRQRIQCPIGPGRGDADRRLDDDQRPGRRERAAAASPAPPAPPPAPSRQSGKTARRRPVRPPAPSGAARRGPARTAHSPPAAPPPRRCCPRPGPACDGMRFSRWMCRPDALPDRRPRAAATFCSRTAARWTRLEASAGTPAASVAGHFQPHARRSGVRVTVSVSCSPIVCITERISW